jgi:bleomycin hydrolase
MRELRHTARIPAQCMIDFSIIVASNRIHLTMKLYFLLFTALWLSFHALAQDSSPYGFELIDKPLLPEVEDQCATSTCWSFATMSFFEAEIMRKGKGRVDLSEMFNVRHTYMEKAEDFVRYQGKQQFGPGGLAHDALKVVERYGMVPEQAYPGLKEDQKEHNHGVLDVLLEGLVKNVVEKNLFAQGNSWIQAVDAILDAMLGVPPTSFNWNTTSYTPPSFRDAMGIQANDYVSFTSFTHHPFYQSFVLEVPDNWSKGNFYNVPLDELQSIADNALKEGYTVAWDADVSEPGFSFRQGVAILPVQGTKKEEFFTSIAQEEKVNQQNRQEAFNMQQTTDDHLMHIVGRAKDKKGNAYYYTKNSWGIENPYKGFQYVSAAYFRKKTVSLMVNKEAVPESIRTKLGI